MKSARYLPIPITHDLDRSPQLVTVATAQAVLAAIQLTLDRAHPILAIPRSRDAPGPELSDAEHFAQLAVLAAEDLAERLADYAAALERDHDDPLPF